MSQFDFSENEDRKRPARRGSYRSGDQTNYAKWIFYLLLGIAVFLLVGGVFTYFRIVEVPDQEYHSRCATSTKLLNDYLDKSKIHMAEVADVPKFKDGLEEELFYSRKLTEGRIDHESTKAWIAYFTHLSDLVSYVSDHRYMPDHAARLKARQDELESARRLR
jgi:hypothetical protein